MAKSQGWTRPRTSQRVHYVLNERSLCRRWTVPYFFRRLFDGKLALNPSFVARLAIPNSIGRTPRKLCTDCVYRYQQLQRNFGIPVEQPESQPVFGG